MTRCAIRILQLISKNDRYGAQRIFLDQVAALAGIGQEVIVVGRGEAGFVANTVRAMGVEYLGSDFSGISALLSLRRLVKDRRIDVIHSTLDRADYFGIMAGLLTRKPVVSTMMVPRCHAGYRFMDRVAVLSRKQQDILIHKGVRRSRIDLVRPGINVNRFLSPDPVKREFWRNELATAGYSLIFCHISSMLERKAHCVSIELVAACKQRGERPLLIVIGDPLTGPYYDALNRMIGEQGLAGNVVFTGWTQDVSEILSLSHFTTLPSANEALGVVLMEGMAAGTPIIARAGEGGAELIEDYKSGFIYDPAEGVQQLAEQVLSCHRSTNAYRALSEHCRTTATGEFSQQRFAHHLMTLYEKAGSES